MILLLWACAEPVDCSAAPSWDSWAAGFFVSYCASCHAASSPDRHGAPENVILDSEKQVYEQKDGVVRTVLEQQTMPPYGGVYAEDLGRLQLWLDCN